MLRKLMMTTKMKPVVQYQLLHAKSHRLERNRKSLCAKDFFPFVIEHSTVHIYLIFEVDITKSLINF